MRLSTVTLLVVTATLLLAGCATQRLVPPRDTAPVSLADRGALAQGEMVFLPCGADVEGACATVLPMAEAAEEIEGEPKNKIAFFLGGTFEEEAEGFSIGLDYERIINETWAVVGFVEHTFGDARESVAGAGLALHPIGGLFLFAGAGVAISREEEERVLIRLGGGYDFPIGRGFFIAPCAYVDWVEPEDVVIVAGLNLGKEW